MDKPRQISESQTPEVPLRSFQALNLRCNPFGEPSFEDRIALTVAAPVVVPTDTAVQIIAPPGMGKTSLLLAQLRLRNDAVYWRAAQTTGTPKPENGRALLLLDEADMLPPKALRRMIRPWPMVLAATHRDLSFRTGRPTETIFLEPLELPDLLARLERRIEWARLGPGPLPRLDEDLVERLRRIHRGNVRAIEDDLYEYFQALKSNPDADFMSHH